MRFFYFFPVFIAVCAFSLCFRLNTLFAKTMEETPTLATEIEILNQKILNQQNQSLSPTTDTEIVFNLTPDEEEQLTHLEEKEKAAYLAKLYGSMRPKAAARILQQLDEKQILLILTHLPSDKAAAIIAEIPPQQAGTLTLQMAHSQSEE